MLQKLWIALIFVGGLVPAAIAQKHVLQSSVVKFYSEAPVEDITATSTSAISIFNSSTSEIVFSIPIKTFEFEKQLMQEHFNEKYMESGKHPRSIFSGRLEGFQPDKQGPQQVTAKGKLTIHGVTKEIEVAGKAEFDSNKITLQAEFFVLLVDYNIEIPQLLWQNIAEEIKVSVSFTYLR